MSQASQPVVLVVGGSELQQDGLSALFDVTVASAASGDAALATLGGADGPVDVIVIGPGLRQPLMEARRLHRASPLSQVVFVASGEALERLSTMLAYLPDLSGAWTLDSAAPPGRVHDVVTQAAELARGQRHRTALSGRLNRALARADELGEAERRRRRLSLSQRFFEAVLSQAPDPIFATDLQGRLLNWNEAAVDLFGPRPDNSDAAATLARLPQAWRSALGDLLARVAAGEAVTQREFQLPRRDGTVIDLSLSAAPVRDDTGAVASISFIARDVSERKQAEARQQLLLRELNHRVKNTLALVRALIRRTAQGSASVADFLESIDGRLQAMSAAHAVLSANWWRGVSLLELTRVILDPHLRDGRVELDIDDVPLPPDLASSLSLVLHELASNALKYGALSGLAGQVHVTGRFQERAKGDGPARQLTVVWQEEGGPPLRPPSRQGFGTRLLTQLISYQHGGDVAMDWAESGLTCRFTIPVEPAPAAEAI